MKELSITVLKTEHPHCLVGMDAGFEEDALLIAREVLLPVDPRQDGVYELLMEEPLSGRPRETA